MSPRTNRTDDDEEEEEQRNGTEIGEEARDVDQMLSTWLAALRREQRLAKGQEPPVCSVVFTLKRKKKMKFIFFSKKKSFFFLGYFGC